MGHFLKGNAILGTVGELGYFGDARR
ncbi:MAG: hypothetical protein QOJ54_1088, partial [Aliidongia sp.]|nr:hypothetical protein [Aliidongia sp.]